MSEPRESRRLEPMHEHRDAIDLETNDSLRALSLAETLGWERLGGLPEGSPTDALCCLGNTTSHADGADLAMLCRNPLKNTIQIIPFCEVVVDGTRDELAN